MNRTVESPKLVLIDVGGVIASNDMTVAAEWLGVRASVDEMLDAFAIAQNAADEATNLDERNRFVWRKTHQILTGEAKSHKVEEWIRHTETPEGNPWINLVPMPGAKDAMARLVEAGIRVALLSNAHDSLEANLRRAGICQVGDGDGVPVEAIYASSVVGYMKPDRRFFEFALNALDVTASGDVWMIGDSLHADVDAALAVGLTAVHVNRADQCGAASHDDVRTLAQAADLALGIERQRPGPAIPGLS